jgi:hypothetical protein
MEIQAYDDKDCEIASRREAPPARITTASSEKEEVESWQSLQADIDRLETFRNSERYLARCYPISRLLHRVGDRGGGGGGGGVEKQRETTHDNDATLLVAADQVSESKVQVDDVPLFMRRTSDTGLA